MTEPATKKTYYEMTAYQKSRESILIKGKLFLSSYEKIGEKGNVEFYLGKDLNEQNLFIIREVTVTKFKKGKEEVPIENCDLFITRITPNVAKILKEQFSSS